LDKHQLKITGDGSHTLYVKSLDETYHSVHGAVQEAEHVYLDAGMNFLMAKDKIDLLEVGFGTGLNAFLTFRRGDAMGLDISYHSIEAFPLKIEQIDELNYIKELNADSAEKEIFSRLHTSEWNKEVEITPSFKLKKINSKLEHFVENSCFDLIYFDAFGPRVQPELWTEGIFKNMFETLRRGGVLVTYSAKGSVKRALKAVGFTIESIPGPPGKREMTRAIKL
jgi:tRNA U34 5-methylaminomethyl-2-thiouridine-forming methyltransferase MnmC